MSLVFLRENIQLHIIENLMFVYSSQLAIFLNYEIFNHVFFPCSLLIYFFTVDKNIFFYSLSHLLMYFYLINKTFALLSFPFLIKLIKIFSPLYACIFKHLLSIHLEKFHRYDLVIFLFHSKAVFFLFKKSQQLCFPCLDNLNLNYFQTCLLI